MLEAQGMGGVRGDGGMECIRWKSGLLEDVG